MNKNLKRGKDEKKRSCTIFLKGSVFEATRVNRNYRNDFYQGLFLMKNVLNLFI